jgi:hypothetical protein
VHLNFILSFIADIARCILFHFARAQKAGEEDTDGGGEWDENSFAINFAYVKSEKRRGCWKVLIAKGKTRRK